MLIKSNTLAPSLTELQIIQQGNNLLISAILLHQKLKIKTRFSDWIQRRVEKYGFEENLDFYSDLSKSTGGRKATDYLLTLDTAKELAMLEENEIGRSIRRYFIQKEKEARGLVQLPSDKEAFRGLKGKNINGRKLYPYRAFLLKAGYSEKSSGYHYRKAYPGHFVVMGSIAHISEELAQIIFAGRKLLVARKAAKAMQPVLPFNFGEPIQLKGGYHA